MKRWLRDIFLVVFAFRCLGCGDDVVPVATPEVWIGGCKEVRVGTCILKPKAAEVVLWVDTPLADTVALSVDGVRTELEPGAVEGGVQLRVAVAPGTKRISLDGATQQWRDPWTLGFERETTPNWLRTVDDLVVAGKVKDATEYLQAQLEAMEGWPRLLALDKLRRLFLARGRIREAFAVGAEQVSLARSIDAPRMETYALATEAHTRIVDVGDLAGARAPLARLRELGTGDAIARMRANYIGGILARRSGDIDGALRQLRESRITGTRLGNNRGLIDVVEIESMSLGELGRGDEALELSRTVFELVRGTDLGCTRSKMLAYNFGWTQLVLAAADLPHDEPRPYFMSALKLLEECPDPWDHANVLIDLALTELQEGNPNDALGWLARIDEVPGDLVPWVEEARAQAGTDLRDPLVEPSLMALPRSSASSVSSTDSQMRWSAMVRRADSARRWGFFGAALESYREAEALLDRRLDNVGIDTGSELFLAGRSASAEGLVGTLYELGRLDEALCAARIARARGMARLDQVTRLAGASEEQRAQWDEVVFEVAAKRRRIAKRKADLWSLSVEEQTPARVQIEEETRTANGRLDEAVRALGLRAVARSCDDLRPPAEGEVLIALIESEGDWIVFAARGDEVEAERVETKDLWSEREWLSSFDSVEDASLITLIPAGASWGLRLQAASWRGRPLIELAPVRFSLDLPIRNVEGSLDRRALVVADPNENLPRAREEAAAVAERLSDQKWNVDARTGRDAAAIGSAIGESRLFHYAGHGDRKGLSGWESALVLGDGQRFGVHDILALQRVPQGVVLTGCLTGAVSPETLGGGMNLGRAFVLSGSSWVVASDEKVADTLARDVGIALYANDDLPDDGPRALRAALLDVRAKDPASRWTSFRVVTP